MKRPDQQEFDLEEVMEKIRAEVSKKGHSRQQPQTQVALEATKNPVLLAIRPLVNFSYKIPLIGPLLKSVVAVIKKRLLEKRWAIRESFQDETEIVPGLLKISEINLSTDYPAEIARELNSNEKLLKEIKNIYGTKDDNDYFKSSVPRYRHYLAFARTLPKGSKILDVGSAPGHVSVGLYLLGMDLTCINLNEPYREQYPDEEWFRKLRVEEFDIEKSQLRFPDNMFDAVYFTEVLEHVAIGNPLNILSDFKRVLRPGGTLVLSTPNVCNISNIYALLKGKNIFWPSDIFYGGLERHNREYTPDEVYSLVEKAGYMDIKMYGMNCHSNWREGGNEFAYKVVGKGGDGHPLLRNTIMLLAKKPGMSSNV